MKLRGEITAFLVILFFFALSEASCAALIQPRLCDVVPAYSSITLPATSNVGDIYINGSETFRIYDCQFNETGTIFVQDNSTLDVENATLTLIVTGDSSPSDVISAQNKAHVLISNSTVKIIRYNGDWAGINATDNAEIDIIGSTFLGRDTIADRVYLFSYDSSRISIEDSNMTVEDSAVYTYGNSSSSIDNSTVPSMGLCDNSSVSVKNSFVLGISTDGDSGQTAINITDSNVWTVVSWGKASCKYVIENSNVDWLVVGSDSSAYIVDTSGNQLDVDTNSTVLLVGSSWNRIEGNGVLIRDWFFGLTVPLFPPAPYAWVLPLEALVITIVIVGIGALFLVGVRARAKKEQK